MKNKETELKKWWRCAQQDAGGDNDVGGNVGGDANAEWLDATAIQHYILRLALQVSINGRLCTFFKTPVNHRNVFNKRLKIEKQKKL